MELNIEAIRLNGEKTTAVVTYDGRHAGVQPGVRYPAVVAEGGEKKDIEVVWDNITGWSEVEPEAESKPEADEKEAELKAEPTEEPAGQPAEEPAEKKTRGQK